MQFLDDRLELQLLFYYLKTYQPNFSKETVLRRQTGFRTVHTGIFGLPLFRRQIGLGQALKVYRGSFHCSDLNRRRIKTSFGVPTGSFPTKPLRN